VGPLSHCTWYRASNQVQYRTSIELCTELGKKTSLGAQFSTEPKCCTVRSLGAVGWTSSGLAEGAEGLRLGLLLLLLLAQVTAPAGARLEVEEGEGGGDAGQGQGQLPRLRPRALHLPLGEDGDGRRLLGQQVPEADALPGLQRPQGAAAVRPGTREYQY